MFGWLRKRARGASTGNRRGLPEHLPVNQPTSNAQVVNVFVNSDDVIRIGDDEVAPEDLYSTLRQYVGQDVVMYYQRDNPAQLASNSAMDVIHIMGRLRLTVAFPPEAKATIDKLMRQLNRSDR